MTKPINKKTSPNGFVTEQPGGLNGRLWDYDIDGRDFKSAHRQFLDRVVAAIKAEPKKGWRVSLKGTADRLGAAGYNVGLSFDRAKRVEAYIRRNLPPGAAVTFDPKGFGEGPAAEVDPDETPDAWFRAVEVALTPSQAPKPVPPPPPPKPKPERPRVPRLIPLDPPPPPRPSPPPPPLSPCVPVSECPTSDNFDVQLLGAFTMGDGLEVGGMALRIRDLTNRLQAQYVVATVGF